MRLFKMVSVILLLISVASSGCKKKNIEEDENTQVPYKTEQAYVLNDISYGSNSEQNMDVYLPAGRNSLTTKVFVLVHGGGWNAGDKSDFDYMFNTIKTLYPTHAIVNLNYRLATASSPGFPKQINDIKAALQEIQSEKYALAKAYFFIGSSAGGHLSLLYGYNFDTQNTVKAICNVVGPTDFTDSAYTQDPNFLYGLYALVGPETYAQNPGLHASVSPVKFVKTTSPKTISFYGDSDPLIPNSQMTRLHTELDAKGVVNSKTMYVGEGHGNWSQENSNDFALKLVDFVNQHFN